MNKTDLVKDIATKAGVSQAIVKNVFDATLESIGQALRAGDKIQLIGFGTFSVQDKPARVCINPATKEKIEVPARKVVKFKAGTNILG